MIGYSQQLVKANKAANQQHIGVRLGKLCIAKEVPVQVVSRMVGVSRTTIYSWFTGKCLVNPCYVPNIKRVLKELA
jgi:hypothetical protein